MPRASTSQNAYERIAATLRRRIESGKLQPGTMLPSEAAIGKEFRVARGTVRQALVILEDAGLVRSSRRRGDS